MVIKNIAFKNYRNLSENLIYPCENINVIYGSNAQGKTNLLELMWLFTGGKSFRGAKDKELIQFEKSFSEIKLCFKSENREQNIKLIYKIVGNDVKKYIYLNNVQKNSSSMIIGAFRGVVFSPVHLSLVKNGPNMRRNFVDAALCQIEPSYAFWLSKYNKILKNRNVLLKSTDFESLDNNPELDVWESELSKVGSVIIKKRIDYCDKIKKITEVIYNELAVNDENISISYKTSFENNNNLSLEFQQALKQKRKLDQKYGYTTLGAHRDDIIIKINGLDAKSYASQGQQRFIVLALKLAEAEILRKYTNEKPVIFLDDVLSELDLKRQTYLINNIKDFQVFITGCELNELIKKSNAKIFNIENGVIRETQYNL